MYTEDLLHLLSNGHLEGFPGGASGKESAYQCRRQVPSLGQEDSLEEGMATTPVFSHVGFRGQRSLAG